MSFGHTYVPSRFEEELFPGIYQFFWVFEWVACIVTGGVQAAVVGILWAGEALEDHVFIEPRLLLQLGDDVAGSHASTHVHCHADPSEQRSLDADDVMGWLMGLCACACM